MVKRIGLIFIAFITLTACKKDVDPVKENASIVPNDFLSGENYQSLEIDLVFVEGSGPNEAAIANMKNFLLARLNKPGGISITQRSIPSPVNFTYSIEDIRSIETENRKLYPEGINLAVFLFYADSDYSESSESSKVLGVKYGPSSMAIFKSSIEAFSGGLGEVSEEKLETTVLKHEFGHVLGLTNIGSDMVSDHEDPENHGHCDNPDCLMYYAVESSGFAEFLFGEEIPELDEQCLQDLQANGGK